MTDEVLIALIGAAAAILGALHLPKIYDYVFSFFSEKEKEKKDRVKQLEKKVIHYKTIMKNQHSEIFELKNQINSINVHLNVIIPILMQKFENDPKTVDLLKHLQNSIKTKPINHSKCEG